MDMIASFIAGGIVVIGLLVFFFIDRKGNKADNDFNIYS